MTTKNIKSGLYIVATPIGNLKDITYRAVETLLASDIILCEDTRTSKKLLDTYNIKSKLESLHEYNERTKIDFILQQLSEEKVISLISDAGTPLISDPGYNLVKSCTQKGYYVTAIPGACSAITALTLSSFPTNSFFFAGFFPVKTTARTKLLFASKKIESTLIFFETANRLEKCLADIGKVFPHTQVAIAKELTKMFEEVLIDTAESLITKIQSGKIVLKGEIVLLINNSIPETTDEKMESLEIKSDAKSIKKMADDLHKKDTSLTQRKISKVLSAQLQMQSSDIYKILTKKND